MATTREEQHKRFLRDLHLAPQRGENYYLAAQGRDIGTDTSPEKKASAPVLRRFFWAGDPLGGTPHFGNESSAVHGAIAHGFGIMVLGYGPMIAEGDTVVVEWESFVPLDDGTVYNNYCCNVVRFEDGKPFAINEYLDTHHIWTVIGRYPDWPALAPHRAPRIYPSQTLRGYRPASPLEDLETFEFDLDPRLLADPVPTCAPDNVAEPGSAANKKIVRAMREAQARGDAQAVNGFYVPGFRSFIAGDRPFGWNHLPVAEIYAPLVENLASPLHVKLGPMVAEGDQVFEEMTTLATLKDGTVYNNWHCFIHRLTGGRIIETREYLDTHHVWVTLGRHAKWGMRAIEPLRRMRRSNLPYVDMTIQTPNPLAPRG